MVQESIEKQIAERTLSKSGLCFGKLNEFGRMNADHRMKTIRFYSLGYYVLARMNLGVELGFRNRGCFDECANSRRTEEPP